MNNKIETIRTRIEQQGFLNLDNGTLMQINPWLRLSPAICMIWAPIGTLLNSSVMLWALVPFALLVAVLPNHPFDLIYTYVFRNKVNGARLPRYAMPRRFGCVMGVIMLSLAAWGFQTGNTILGNVAGWM